MQVPVYIMGGWHDELRDQGIIALLNLPGSRILDRTVETLHESGL